MTAPVPQTIGNRLLGQLEGLFDSAEEPSDFLLRRLDAEANQLMRADPAEGMLVKAGLAALRWQVDEAVTLATRCTQLDHSPGTLSNAALTVRQVNRMDEACSFMARALDLVPRDKVIVSRAIIYLMHAGRFKEAANLMQQADGDGVDVDEVVQGEADPVGFANRVEEMGINLARAHHEVQCAYQVLTRHRVRPRTITYRQLLEPDGGGAVVISIGVLGDLALEMRLEADLAELLIEGEGWNPALLGVEFETVAEHAHEPA